MADRDSHQQSQRDNASGWRRMDPQSSSALLWFSVILVVIGSMVISRDGRTLLILMSSFTAALPTVFGPARHRVFGYIILGIVLALVVVERL